MSTYISGEHSQPIKPKKASPKKQSKTKQNSSTTTAEFWRKKK